MPAWAKKHGKSHCGYKNHVNVDRKHKLVRRYHLSDASLHDSQAVDHLSMRGITGSGVWADSASRSAEMEAKLHAQKLKSCIHRKGKRGKPVTEQVRKSNWTKSAARVRVEHTFGAKANDMGGTLGCTIGPIRAEAKIGMKDLAYNMRRHCLRIPRHESKSGVKTGLPRTQIILCITKADRQMGSVYPNPKQEPIH